MPTTLALTVAYDGRGFAGFARQPGLVTVQGRLETALATVFRQEVETVGAGRTDAGVHALAQVVSCVVESDEVDTGTALRSLNALVGDGIVVTGVRMAAPDFDARRSAVAREYRYRIAPGPVPPMFLAPYSWWVKGTLDLETMRAAGSSLVGEHDFKSFCVAASAEGIRTHRRLYVVEMGPETAMGEQSIVMRVVGNAFLHSMVRAIVGSLVEVGLGRRPAGWMAEALAARDRTAAGPTAPAAGLTLWHVTYPEECWR
ncbi:MAG: tRNA pseudouridine(38-40) synthase TruA [Actinobacteria bacterium]|nr:tRNA pseudouridine(38-40) synthase TruA [Actinomycetota bacterium]